MILYVVFALLIVMILILLHGNSKESYWEVYNMPDSIPKTYISTHFIRNPPPLQPSNI